MKLSIALCLGLFVLGALALPAAPVRAADSSLSFAGGEGPGKGKHIVLVSGDEEYRSEETLPQLGKILAKHHGCKCTVLFAIDLKDGTINPNQNNNIPGLEALKTADLMIIFTRFRNLPDDQMQHIDNYLDIGQTDHRSAHGHARLQHRQGQPVRQVLLDKQGLGRRLRPAGAGRDLDQPSWRPRQPEHRAASSPREPSSIPSCAASRTATSGARPTSTASVCRLPGDSHAAGHGPGAQGHEVDRRSRCRARRTIR